MSILVTVFIPTYKRFDSIYKTIQSALSQDYSNIELFVSDDGSQDFPLQEITNYIEANKNENIVSYHVLDNKVNLGTVKHINNILKQAKGDLIIPLAGDDCYYNSSVVSKIVERYKQTHFYVLSTSRVMFEEEGKYHALIPHFRSREYIQTKMVTAQQQHKAFTECTTLNFASGSAMAYEAEFLKKMNYFDEKYRLWEDGPFINKMTSSGFAITTAYDIISIKYRSGGVSSGGNPIIRQDIIKFNASDRWIKSDEYGWYHKRVLTYTQKKFMPYNKMKHLINKLLYCDVALMQMLYRLHENSVAKYDIPEIIKNQE